MKKICVMGLGYIGLPTCAMFAKNGVQVVGVDILKEIVDTINKGEIHLEEPLLGDIVKDVVNEGTLRASLEPEEADVFIVAVPTPNNNDHYKSCDLNYVVSATNALLPYIKKGNLIIIESTIAPRTIDDIIVPLIKEKDFSIGSDIFLAHCPERVLPGQIIKEMIENTRIIGGYTQRCTEVASNIYEIFVTGEIVKTDAKTAEMAKLVENTFRDVNIALANELAKVCNRIDINVLSVIEMANKHPRVNIHQPGPGVGGHCLAVDPYFIIEKAPELSRLISMSRDTNSSMPYFVVDNVKKILEDIADPKIAIFGLTYKGNVDDIRESPAIKIYHMLENQGYRISLYDPYIKHDRMMIEEHDESIKDADLILILADHKEFKELDKKIIKGKMRRSRIFDTKNIVKNINTNDNDIEYINMGNLFEYIK